MHLTWSFSEILFIYFSPHVFSKVYAWLRLSYGYDRARQRNKKKSIIMRVEMWGQDRNIVDVSYYFLYEGIPASSAFWAKEKKIF